MSDELVLFMKLPVGVEATVIPGVLASRNIPFVLSERFLARQVSCVEIRVPASRLKDAQAALRDAKAVGETLEQDAD